MPPRSPVRKRPNPLDSARLEELALAYVARFATSESKLKAYLGRKLRERGWAGEDTPPVAAMVARLAAAGYVDDAAYARAKGGSLLRRGYGARRIAQALSAAGIDHGVHEDVSDAAQRRAALAMARKRGFGPFGMSRPDRAGRERQIAAMLRAGHPMDFVRELVDAPSIEMAEQWAEEGDTCE